MNDANFELHFKKLVEELYAIGNGQRFIEVKEIHQNFDGDDYDILIDRNEIKVNHDLDMIELIDFDNYYY